jgi:hypothetical protein
VDGTSGCGDLGPIPVAGNLSLLNNSAFAGFAGFAVHGALIVRGRTGGVEILATTIGGSAIIAGNAGGVILAGDSFGGALLCSANTPPPFGFSNSARGAATGQCAGPVT